ncbi:MAG: hypothetical protein RIC19_09080 [Phaeodactylibacter sp.]|uniref:phosphopeptide-binding protein n=1 Tax=Phaeodactylibacter sp. TaxID=1940289 RepID=UPI0032EFC063
MRTLSLLFVLALFFTSCQSGGDATGTDGATADSTAVEEAPAMKYTLTPFSPSESYPDAAIEGVTYADGKFNFMVGGETYKLGVQTPDADAKMCANSAKGQHIHLIIDDQPYAAKYEAAFDYEIEDGDHYMLAFLSRSYHESIKTNAAHVAKKVTVKDNGFMADEDFEEPILFYSRPKGTYTGKAQTEKVMLDFYPVNVPGFGTDHMVKATINGEDHMIDTWQPYYVEGLPMGENTITLTLVDAEGNKVDTPLNPVTRTFTLQEDPAE